MDKNFNKGDSYKLVFSNLKISSKSDDVFHLIGLIAATESIISDRLSSFLGGTKNDKFLAEIKNREFIPLSSLLKFSKKDLSTELNIKSKISTDFKTNNLYYDLKNWNRQRNNVIHAVCKSKCRESHPSLGALLKDVQDCCNNGYKFVRLLLKWSAKQKNESKNT